VRSNHDTSCCSSPPGACVARSGVMTRTRHGLIASTASDFVPTVYGATWALAAVGQVQATFTAVKRSEELLPRILQVSLRLLRGDVVALSLYDARSHRYRLMGVASADARWSEWRSLVCRVPPDFAVSPDSGASHSIAGVTVLPNDDRQHPFASLFARGGSTAVYAALYDPDGGSIGTLHVVRQAACPFDERERRLARSIADHATLALIQRA